MRIIIFLLSFFVSTASSVETRNLEPQKPITLKFGKNTHRFLHFPHLHLTLSESCGTQVKQMSCMAALSLKSVSLKSIPHGKLASRNPGSVACTEILHERVVIGTDSHRNENSFCLFKDGSRVDTGTLTYYARKNDHR